MELEDRIRAQYPALYITLFSVLIGLEFSDLASEAHTRMTLWPLDLGTLRTWAQLFTMGTNAVVAWIAFVHIGVSRLRIPSLADSIVVFLLPVPLLFANALVGTKDIWPWFYYASFYLVISLGAWLWQVRMATKELPAFARLRNPLGPPLILYIGIPFYAAAGWADSHGWLSPLAELLVAISPVPAALILAHLFFREWHRAIAETNAHVKEPVRTG